MISFSFDAHGVPFHELTALARSGYELTLNSHTYQITATKD